jgi:succinate dehydrogenase/fumarate reductase flavoprotein subunit
VNPAPPTPLSPARPLRPAEVPRFDCEADVVVVGHGAAGGCAAIEAARAGASVLVIERMSRGGGATALSTGITYFGGGTRIQRACGFADSVEDMQAYVRLAAGAQADPERVRLYCEGSLEHFEWFCSLGVEWNESYCDDRVTHPLGAECLLVSGNEEAWPFCEQARPAPRGHKPAREGEAGGYLMEAVLRAGEKAGVRVLGDCLARALVQREDRRVIGVAARREGRALFALARRGVILASGGFVMNREMLAHHAPNLLHINHPTGTAGDDGSGIRMGVGAGGEAIGMGEGLLLNSWYPPSSHLSGILVDARGQRFVNEDASIGRTSDAIVTRADARAWLVVDDAIYGRTQARHRLAAVEESFEALEAALGIPEGALVRTILAYNRAAAKGEDPLFHKARRWLRPLASPPYAALDTSPRGSIWGGFTLGGLRARASGEVLDSDGAEVPGLYAAGRATAGLCREGRSYASGLSIGDATFFGRLAGRRAAGAPPWR